MPSRKNKRFAKKKGKASLKKTFSKKRIVGGLNQYALADSINVSNVNEKKEPNNVSTLESTTPPAQA